MRLAHIIADDFDLARTLDSGQVFHWEKCGHGFIGTIGAKGVYVEQRRNRLLFEGATARMIAHYFALDHPLEEICRSFPADAAMCAARDFCQGLRIMRQPVWECLATFITSSMKQVAHIRQISQMLRIRYGKRKRVFDCDIHIFPPASRIAELTEQELRECALGYRAKNLLATAHLIDSGDVDLEQWTELSDELLRARLCELPGVGAKIANCVMLFAYERLYAFPIDVWIERVLKEKYFPRRRMVRTEELRIFSAKYFGSYGGYAQQYLFHHARTGKASRAGQSDARAS
jgi:N-glycosylase/DNA lyase